jgi:hypothetical protein
MALVHRTTPALLALVAALALPGTAHAAPHRSARAILTELAGQVTHGWRDDKVPLNVLEQRLVAGKRIVVTCGTVTLLARRSLQRAGIESRVVTTITRQPFNDIDNGHTMIEVRTPAGWEVWDVDNNRRAIDAHGHGMNIVQLVNAGRAGRRWERIADDRVYNLTGATPRVATYAKHLYADIETWYDRVLGVPLIQLPSGYGFGDAGQRERVEAYAPGSYHWLAPAAWKQLQDAADGPRPHWDVDDPMVPARISHPRVRARPVMVRYRLSFATTVRLTLDTRSCPTCAWRRLAERTSARPAGVSVQPAAPRKLRPLPAGTYRIGVKAAWAAPTFLRLALDR